MLGLVQIVPKLRVVGMLNIFESWPEAWISGFALFPVGNS